MQNFNVMAIFRKHLSLPFLSFATIVLVSLRMVNSSDSLDFTFSEFHQNEERLLFQGDARVTSNNILQLTETDSNGVPKKNSVGRTLYYAAPMHLWEQSTNRLSTFETTFTFDLTSPQSNPADGFVFFIAPTDTTIPEGSVGGLLGLFDPKTAEDPKANQVFAVEFDTFYDQKSNSWDPKYEHIGIDVNTIKSSAHVRWDRREGKIGTARINYNSATKNLSVVSSYPGSEQYAVSHIVDLRTKLPQWVRIGFSAATGEQYQVHNIRSWFFSSTLIYVPPKKEEMYIARVV